MQLVKRADICQMHIEFNKCATGKCIFFNLWPVNGDAIDFLNQTYSDRSNADAGKLNDKFVKFDKCLTGLPACFLHVYVLGLGQWIQLCIFSSFEKKWQDGTLTRLNVIWFLILLSYRMIGDSNVPHLVCARISFTCQKQKQCKWLRERKEGRKKQRIKGIASQIVIVHSSESCSVSSTELIYYT